QMIAAALAFSLYGGFPETAYICGLMALAWAVCRFATAPASARGGFAVRVGAGGAIGLALAAPILVPFVHLLGQSTLGAREAIDMGRISMPEPGDALYVVPYVLGPIAGYSGLVPSGDLVALWGRASGYLGFPLAVAAACGIAGASRSERGLRYLLGGWILASFLRSAAVPVAGRVWDTVPGMSQ